jgi:hypothetical protein
MPNAVKKFGSTGQTGRMKRGWRTGQPIKHPATNKRIEPAPRATERPGKETD